MGAVEFDDKEVMRLLEKLQSAKQVVKGYDVGFFENARYLDGTQVSEVAFYNEFGTSNGIPERPFFRQANASVEKKLIRLVSKEVNESNSFVLKRAAVDRMALVHEGEVKESITNLKEPPNKPSTIKAKGSANPLIDTGTMRASVTHKVIK